jgi:hypothetical protein
MIHAAWLFLIIPAAVAIGFFTCALCTVAKESDARIERLEREPWPTPDPD